MECIEISRNSDLVLIVSEKLEIHVSSVVLCNTSDVFRAMLNSQWAEGQSLQKDNTAAPAQIKLLDDSADSIAVFCAALHQRNDLIKDSITADEIYDVAMLADKYDCTTALKHTATSWFNSFSDQQIQQAPVSMALAAYRFDHAEAFGRITNVLVKTDSLFAFKNMDGPTPVRGLADMLHKAHAAAASSLQLKIGSIAERAVYYMAPGHCSPYIERHSDGRHVYPEGCNIRKNLAIKFLDRLSASGVWQPADPLRTITFSYMVQSFSKLNIPEYDLATACNDSNCAYVCRGFLDIMEKKPGELKEEAIKINAGMCLDCFKAQEMKARPCRIKH